MKFLTPLIAVILIVIGIAAVTASLEPVPDDAEDIKSLLIACVPLFGGLIIMRYASKKDNTV
jgi:hypothetical protein